jgi:hypothetical protein
MMVLRLLSLDRIQFGNAGIRQLLELPSQLGICRLPRKLQNLLGLPAKKIF